MRRLLRGEAVVCKQAPTNSPMVLLSISVVVAALAALTVVRPPLKRWGWMLALAVGEYGHWLAVVPVGLALVAWGTTDGALRGSLLALNVAAFAAFWRPAFSAWRIEGGGFSFFRLYWHPAPPAGKVETVEFSREGERPLTLDVYTPPGGGLRPVMLVIHGGGWDSGDNSQLPEWNHRWAARGWVVVAINYRLAPGHPWPAQREDALAAIRWVKDNAARLGADPHRIVVLGRSAGGQIATAVAYGAHDPDIRGVIALYAPHDMPFAWSVSREDDALNSINLMRQYLGGPPDDTPARRALYESASGQLLAEKDSPATLLLHGYPDTLVWHRHSVRLAARLRELGVPVTHLELPWATHAFDFNPDGPGGQVADAAIREFCEKLVF